MYQVDYTSVYVAPLNHPKPDTTNHKLFAFCNSTQCKGVNDRLVVKDAKFTDIKCPDCPSDLYWDRVPDSDIELLCRSTQCTKRKTVNGWQRNVIKMKEGHDSNKCNKCGEPLIRVLKTKFSTHWSK